MVTVPNTMRKPISARSVCRSTGGERWCVRSRRANQSCRRGWRADRLRLSERGSRLSAADGFQQRFVPGIGAPFPDIAAAIGQAQRVVARRDSCRPAWCWHRDCRYWPGSSAGGRRPRDNILRPRRPWPRLPIPVRWAAARPPSAHRPRHRPSSPSPPDGDRAPNSAWSISAGRLVSGRGEKAAIFGIGDRVAADLEGAETDFLLRLIAGAAAALFAHDIGACRRPRLSRRAGCRRVSGRKGSSKHDFFQHPADFGGRSRAPVPIMLDQSSGPADPVPAGWRRKKRWAEQYPAA